MAETLTTLRTQLRERLGEATAAAWTDTELDRWINEGARELALRTEWQQSIVDMNVAAQVYKVPLLTGSPTTPIQRIHKAEWIPVSGAAAAEAGGGIQQVYRLTYQSISSLDSIRGTGQQMASGIPVYYSLWGTPSANQTCILYPRPSMAGTLRLHAYTLPVAAASGSDTVAAPEGWHHLVLDYAEFKAKVRDKDPDWQIAKQTFAENVANMKSMFARMTDETEYINPFGDWSEMGWY